MLLAADIGNTNIVLGVFRDGKLLTNWRMATDQAKSADEYGMLVSRLFEHEGIDLKDIDDIIISTVVPSILFTFEHMATKYFNIKPIVVGPGIKTGLVIKYDNPKQVGADRIVNAVSAYTKYGGPLIVIDFGTATTFCAITGNAEYLGGAIAPGIKISSDALFQKTSKLPKVEIEDPGKSICKNTTASMQAGLIYGHMGVVEHIVNKMKEELKEEYNSEKEPVVIATGGLSTMIENGVNCIDHVDKLLTLEGLGIIYEKNRKGSK